MSLMALGFWRRCFAAIAAIAVASASSAATAAIIGPYTTDANTLHLYHMDATAAPIPDVGSAGTLRDLDVVAAGLGVSSFTGFGNAANFVNDADQAKNNVATSQAEWQGANGAFTYEAIVNATTSTSTRTIMSRDHTTGGPNTRSFIFRLNGTSVEFINTGAAGNQTITAAIPAGPDAFATNAWYHVAVAFNGSENTANNFSIYWTKVDPSRTTANLIGTGNLTFDVGNTGGNPPFVVGNRDNVTAANNAWDGLIDEVRVSSVARGADQMLFGVPEPSTGVMALAAMALARLPRRRKA